MRLKVFLIIGLFSTFGIHHQTYSMAALRSQMTRLWNTGRQPLVRAGELLGQAMRSRVTLTEFSQKGVTDAVEAMVKDRVPSSVQYSFKNIIKGPVVDKATLEVFEQNAAKDAKVPSNLFLRFFGESVESKSIAVDPVLESQVRGITKMTPQEQQQKALKLVQEMIKTPQGKTTLDKALTLFKQSNTGKIFWPELEESLRSSIEKTLQSVEVKIVSLPADYWKPKGDPKTVNYAQQLSGKIAQDLFADYNIPLATIAEQLKGITPPPLVTTAAAPGALYGAPEFSVTRSGNLVVKTIPAGLPGKPSAALLEGTSDSVADPALAGALVMRDEQKTQQETPLSDEGLRFLGSSLALLGSTLQKSTLPLVSTLPTALNIPNMLHLAHKYDLVPMWVQPTCLPENLSLKEGDASSLLNEAGDVVAILGHTDVHEHLPAFVYRPIAEQALTLQKTMGYPACMQPVVTVDTKTFGLQLLGQKAFEKEAKSENQKGLVGTFALYVPQALNAYQQMKKTSLTLENKKPVVKSDATPSQALQPYGGAQTFIQQKLVESGIDLELFYRGIIKQLVISSIRIDEPLIKKWVDAGGPAFSTLAGSDAYKQALKLFGAYNELLVLVKTDTDAKTSLNNIKATILTVLGENNDIERIKERLKMLQGA